MDNSDMTTIKFRMSQEEFYAGIASLSPETRKRFIADLLASDPGWAPYLEGIDLEAPGSGTIYRCSACGFAAAFGFPAGWSLAGGSAIVAPVPRQPLRHLRWRPDASATAEPCRSGARQTP